MKTRRALLRTPKLVSSVALIATLITAPWEALHAQNGKGASSLELWHNLENAWGSTAQNNNSLYLEGASFVPGRFVANLPAGSYHTIQIAFNYSAGGPERFIDYLATYDASEAGVDPTQGVSSAGIRSLWTLPTDPEVATIQDPGYLATWNVSSLTFETPEYSSVDGVKILSLSFTVAGNGGGSKNVILTGGFHLAGSGDWGAGNGASTFPGASQKIYVSLDGSSDFNVSINPSAILPTTDVAITKTSIPTVMYAGDELTYELRVSNLGQYTATDVTVTDTLPAAVTFISATPIQTSGPQNLVFSLGDLAAGAEAAIRITVRVSDSFEGTLLNSASVTAAESDYDTSNNTASATTTVTLKDTLPPVLNCPLDISADADSGRCDTVVLFNVTATDENPVTIVCNPPSGSVFPVGQTFVTCTATDSWGNQSSCGFVVTVRDAEAPLLDCPADIVAENDLGKATAVVTFSASAFDNCDGPVAVTFSQDSNTAFPVGTTQVTATAVDTAGNVSTCTFNVTVNDTEAPVIICPDDVVVDTMFGAYKAIVDFAIPTATDNASTPTIAVDLQPNSELEVGFYTVTAIATDAAGNSSSCSFQISIRDQGNVAWPVAHLLELTPSPLFNGIVETEASQYLIQTGQSRWYKFKVQPGSKLLVTLTELAANYDLVLFSDIAAAYEALTGLSTEGDLVHLTAEFAPEAFSPAAFSPEAFSPEAFSPAAFSPAAFSPAAFSPAAFSPAAFSPEAFSPAAFSPEAFSPEAFSPAAFSPAAFSPAAFSPEVSPEAFSPAAFSPAAFSPAAFSSAQTISVVGVSAFEGLAGEGLILNTWENTGEFYVRVRGRNGVFTKDQPFKLQVKMLTGVCADVDPILPESTIAPSAGGFKTIILTDSTRLSGVDNAKLNTLAARPEVAGVIVDVGSDARVIAANVQADTNPECPIAKNLVATSIKEIVDAYWQLNPLEYVVIVGSDNVIPFFRHPDEALLANENNYVPPVRDATSSQASLKLGYILGQDAYGADCSLRRKSTQLPIPRLAVGRLVEKPDEIHAMLDAYLQTSNGVVPRPTSGLVAAYDFLADVGQAIHTEFMSGMDAPIGSLITPADQPPENGWTASQLSSALLSPTPPRMVFIGAHFSAGAALAADYTTRMTANQVAASPVNMINALIISSGCHSGYNVVNEHGVPSVSPEPDWAQAFATKGATLIAGTGYQYGDTDFIDYSERIYLLFARNLRAGTGPVAIGKALVEAKLEYLSQKVQLRGIDEKSMLISTLFGLPMLSVDLPGGRNEIQSDTTIVPAVNGYATDPGLTLGLQSADITVTPTLTRVDSQLVNPEDGSETTSAYFSGGAGVLANPAEPAIPLEAYNVSVAAKVLRGIGFMGGTYADLTGIVPHTGAPATEIRGVHAPFLSDVFFPVRTWSVNYFDIFCDDGGTGATRLMVTPSQFKSDAFGSGTGIMRTFDKMNFRLFYSGNIATYGAGATESVPALAGAPTIVQVSDTVDLDLDQVDVLAQVVGNPTAGIQNVWITFTATEGPMNGTWQSMNLTQNADNSAFWEGTLELTGTNPDSVRYVVQAVNGVGLVTMDANLGEFFTPGHTIVALTGGETPTVIQLQDPVPSTGPYNTPVPVSARLTTVGGEPLGGQRVTFGLGSTARQAFTDANGVASVEFPLLSLPDSYPLQVTFAGTRDYLASVDSAPFEITKQDTTLTVTPASVITSDTSNSGISARLQAANGTPLKEKSVVFIVTGAGGTHVTAVITDYAGRAPLGTIPLPSGDYTINAYFSGVIPIPGESLTLSDDRYNPSTGSAALMYDVDAPVITFSGEIVAEATGPDGAIVTFEITATDNSGGEVEIVNSPESGSLFPLGTTTVTSTATDEVGNTATESFSVTVDDTTPPAITVPANIVVEATGPSGAAVTFTTSAVDLVSGSVPTLSTPASGSTFPLGTTAVTVTAVDAAGNPSSRTFTVTVRDTTPPVITVPADIVAEATSQSGAIVTFTTSATDLVSGNVTTVNTPASGSTFPLGTTTVTVTAMDAAGNPSSRAFTVTVRDTTGPVITSLSVNHPVLSPPNHKMRSITVTVKATDNSGKATTSRIIKVTSNEPIEGTGDGDTSPDWIITGDLTVDLRSERAQNGTGRIYTIYVQATDVFGNKSSGNDIVTVEVPVN